MERRDANKFRGQWLCPNCFLGEDLCSDAQMVEAARGATLGRAKGWPIP